MAKADLRHDDGDVPVERPPPQTAEELVAAIAALYSQLAPNSGQQAWGVAAGVTTAYRAREAQIRALAAQHWRLTSGHTITDAVLPTHPKPTR